MRSHYYELRKILPEIQIREIFQTYYGMKVSRIYVSNRILTKVLFHLDLLNLYYEVSDFSIIEHIEENKGSWHNMAIKSSVDDNNGLRYIYISSKSRLSSIAKKAEEKGDAEYFGELLKIPKCCIDFYITNRKEAIEVYDDDYALITSRNTITKNVYSYYTNYLSQYFGFSLISHFPCSFNCKSTINNAMKTERLIYNKLPEMIKHNMEKLKGIYIHLNKEGIIYIPGIIKNGTTNFDIKNLQYTKDNFIVQLLKTNNSITWKNNFSFDIGEQKIQNKDIMMLSFK